VRPPLLSPLLCFSTFLLFSSKLDWSGAPRKTCLIVFPPLIALFRTTNNHLHCSSPPDFFYLKVIHVFSLSVRVPFFPAPFLSPPNTSIPFPPTRTLFLNLSHVLTCLKQPGPCCPPPPLTLSPGPRLFRPCGVAGVNRAPPRCRYWVLSYPPMTPPSLHYRLLKTLLRLSPWSHPLNLPPVFPPSSSYCLTRLDPSLQLPDRSLSSRRVQFFPFVGSTPPSYPVISVCRSDSLSLVHLSLLSSLSFVATIGATSCPVPVVEIVPPVRISFPAPPWSHPSPGHGYKTDPVVRGASCYLFFVDPFFTPVFFPRPPPFPN